MSGTHQRSVKFSDYEVANCLEEDAWRISVKDGPDLILEIDPNSPFLENSPFDVQIRIKDMRWNPQWIQGWDGELRIDFEEEVLFTIKVHLTEAAIGEDAMEVGKRLLSSAQRRLVRKTAWKNGTPEMAEKVLGAISALIDGSIRLETGTLTTEPGMKSSIRRDLPMAAKDAKRFFAPEGSAPGQSSNPLVFTADVPISDRYRQHIPEEPTSHELLLALEPVCAFYEAAAGTLGLSAEEVENRIDELRNWRKR